MNEDHLKEIKKKVRQQKEFYMHLFISMGIFAILIFINILVSSGTWWSIIIGVGYAVAILIHYFAVFGIPFISNMGKDWEEKEMLKELDKMDEDHLDLEERLDLRQVEKKYRDSDLV